MPELQIFRRRWHISSDIVPVVTTLLAVVHFAFVAPFLAGSYTIESTGIKYDCNVGLALRVAVYGMFALYLAAGVLESAITSIGLKGGPLEERRRRAMTPLLYAEVALWLLLLGWTSYGTFILKSPSVESECWDDNPCAYGEELPAACIGVGATRQLTPSCQLILNNQTDFESCYVQWIIDAMGVRRLLINYNLTTDPEASLDFSCEEVDESAYEWTQETIANPSESIDIVVTPGFDVQDFSTWATDLQIEFLERIGIPYNASHPSTSPPWFTCMNDTCRAMGYATEECTQWDVLLQLPDPSSRKKFFAGLVWASWAVLAITALIVVIAFNSFQEIDDTDSWEGSLRSMSNFCCCGSLLQEAAVDTGGTASSEIAKTLNMLFGGIDLDPTDRLFAAVLVAELQADRRRTHVIRRLEEAGFVAQRRGASAYVKGPSRGRSVRRTATLSPAALVSGEGLDRGEGPPSREDSRSLPGGPGDLSSQGSFHAGDRLASFTDASQGLLPMYRHELLALSHEAPEEEEEEAPEAVMPEVFLARTSAAGHLRRRNGPLDVSDFLGRPSAIPEGVEGGEGEEGGAENGVARAASSSSAASPLKGSSSSGRAKGDGAPLITSRLRVVDRYHPMLTPTGLPRRLRKLLTARAAAGVCTGFWPAVAMDTLRVSQAMARFAISAYGLQSVVWAKGQAPPACLGNANLLLGCLPKALGLSARLRRRNFDALCAVAGVAPADVLLVSHANLPGGALPYHIMRDASSKAIIISLRGTVSMEDLVTDLLSNPIEVSDWMPAWVADANKTGEPMYAHAGILSAATAMLKELEAAGILKEMLMCKLRRRSEAAGFATVGSGASVGAPPSPASALSPGVPGAQGMTRAHAAGSPGLEEPAAPLKRASSQPEPTPEFGLALREARRAIREALSQPGWKVVVTGHSLGAAVACMLSFHLRERLDALECWAFCPPGGLMSWNLSRIAASFCTSTVVGKDVISRLSLSNLKRVVDEMVLALARCRRPKLIVLADVALGRRSGNRVPPATFCDLTAIPDEAMHMLKRYHETSHLHAARQPEMYPPGRIIFLRPFKEGGKTGTQWDAVWVDAAALMGEGILLAPSMLAHHRMFNVADAFASIFAEPPPEVPAVVNDVEGGGVHPV